MDLMARMQERVAMISIGPSTLRNQGASGVARKARELLAALPLQDFAVGSSSAFQSVLDRHTEDIRRRLPRGARHWGTARKALNIFLMHAYWNRPLCRHYGLARVGAWLELPLDSYTAGHLIDKAQRMGLAVRRRWPGVKHLEAGVSAEFQQAAQAIAKRKKVQRIMLDLAYWRQERKQEPE